MIKKIFLVFSILLASSLFVKASQIPPKWDFQGKYLITVSDADMLASAYETFQLGPRKGSDTLTVIPLDTDPQNYQGFAIDAPNSVASPPEVVDVTPDGRFAFVTEAFGQRPGESDEEAFRDLGSGNLLTIVDLADPRSPKQHDQIEIKSHPDSVSVSHDGKYLAIAYRNRGAGQETPIGIYRIKDGKVTAQHYPTIEGFDTSNRLISAQWHPKENILALVNESKATIRFVEIKENSNEVIAEDWGNEVSIGKGPFLGRFSSDGKHYLANNLYWGSDVKGRWTEAPRGTVVNITLNHYQKDGQPMHALTSQVLTGPSPEGFALSPDGKYVAVVNMERSWLPYDDERQTWFSSITLIERDPKTGTMNELHTTPYYAILPEMAVFDASGRYLAVVAYDQYTHGSKEGSVDFFKLVYDPLDKQRKMLVQTPYSVPVQRGAHDIILVN